jgi:proteasome alpha subunit
MGGADDVVAAYLQEHYQENSTLEDALRLAVAALGKGAAENGTPETDRVIPASDLEVAVLDRTRSQPRKFLRLVPARLQALLGDRGPTTPTAPPSPDTPAPGPDSAETPPETPAETEIDPSDIPDENPTTGPDASPGDSSPT